jgi:hypothetical protein
MVCTWWSYRWCARSDVTNGEYALMPQMVSTFWYYKLSVRFDITEGEHALMSQMVSTLWYYKCWGHFDITNGEYALLLQMVRTLWYYKWGVRFDITIGENALILQIASTIKGCYWKGVKRKGVALRHLWKSGNVLIGYGIPRASYFTFAASCGGEWRGGGKGRGCRFGRRRHPKKSEGASH